MPREIEVPAQTAVSRPPFPTQVPVARSAGVGEAGGPLGLATITEETTGAPAREITVQVSVDPAATVTTQISGISHSLRPVTGT